MTQVTDIRELWEQAEEFSRREKTWQCLLSRPAPTKYRSLSHNTDAAPLSSPELRKLFTNAISCSTTSSMQASSACVSDLKPSPDRYATSSRSDGYVPSRPTTAKIPNASTISR